MANNNSTNNSTYVAARSGVGLNAKGETCPYVFALEGGLTAEPQKGQDKAGKDYVRVGLGLRSAQAKAIFARAGVEIQNETEYVDLVGYGPMVKALGSLQKGTRVVVSGRATADKQGKPAMFVDAIVPKTEKLSSSFGRPQSSYNGKSTQMVLLAGEVTSAGAVSDTTSTGKDRLKFSIKTGLPIDKVAAVISGDYDATAKYEQWFADVTVIGDQAKRLSEKIAAGQKLVVLGTFAEKQGTKRNFYDITVWDRGGELFLYRTTANDAAPTDGGNAAPAEEAPAAAEAAAEKPKKGRKAASKKEAPAAPAPATAEEDEELPF